MKLDYLTYIACCLNFSGKFNHWGNFAKSFMSYKIVILILTSKKVLLKYTTVLCSYSKYSHLCDKLVTS